jgi:hypothetical protein
MSHFQAPWPVEGYDLARNLQYRGDVLGKAYSTFFIYLFIYLTIPVLTQYRYANIYH